MPPLACGVWSCAAADDRGDRHVLDLYRLLEQAMEEKTALAGAAAVEAERELVEVEVELVRPGGALVGAEQPTLEQRGDAMGAWHDHVRRVAAGGDAGGLMDETGGGEAAVAPTSDRCRRQRRARPRCRR